MATVKSVPRPKIFKRKLPDGSKIGAIDVQLLHRICDQLWARKAVR